MFASPCSSFLAWTVEALQQTAIGDICCDIFAGKQSKEEYKAHLPPQSNKGRKKYAPLVSRPYLISASGTISEGTISKATAVPMADPGALGAEEEELVENSVRLAVMIEDQDGKELWSELFGLDAGDSLSPVAHKTSRPS